VFGGPFRGVENLGPSRFAPGGPGEGASPTADLDLQIASDLQELRAQIASSRAPDVQAIFLAQSTSLLAFLEQEEKRLREEAEREGTRVDPATQFTIEKLRESLGEQLKATQEDLNARGLYHSGILLEIEQKLRTGAISEEGRILAERLSRLRDNLSARLGQISSQRVAGFQQFGMAGAQAQASAEMDNLARRDDLMRRLIEAQQRERDTALQESQFSRGLDFEAQQAQAEREFRAQEADLNRRSEIARQQADMAWRTGESAIARQWEAEQTRLDREAAMARQQADNAAANYRAQLSASRRGGSGEATELDYAIADLQASGDPRESAVPNVTENADYYKALYGERGYQILLQVAHAQPPLSASYRGRTGGPTFFR
ncbi:MAG: hypothetical protein ACRDJ5_07590, partial [Actinomycetota bacterium]